MQDILHRLTVHLGLPPLPRDALGRCAIRLDERVYSFFPDGADDAFLVRCHVGRIGTEDGEAMLRLLRANLFDDGVGGSALGVDATGSVFLSQYFEADPGGFTRFLQRFELFVGTSEHWAGVLAAWQPREAMA